MLSCAGCISGANDQENFLSLAPLEDKVFQLSSASKKSARCAAL